MITVSSELARWLADFQPTEQDLDLADRALLDTVAVTIAARGEAINALAALLSQAGRWAVVGHILDYDDLHVESTTHISTVCIPVALALGGGPRDYLAGAGVMARLGMALGWRHYDAGWHATATTGVIAAAGVAASCLGLSPDQTSNAFSLAVSSSSGVQRAFGSDAKSLQVGIAAQAGVQAARLAAAGASANPLALEQWLSLVGAPEPDLAVIGASTPAVPGGLAIKMFPCCYALQRPIAAVRELRGNLDPAAIKRIVLTTPALTVVPLNQHNPTTGLEGKFSLEYAVAAAILDDYPGFATFSDAGVRRREATELQDRLQVVLTEDPGRDLLAGECDVAIDGPSGTVRASLATPPGASARPPTQEELAGKVATCLEGTGLTASDITWDSAAGLLRDTLPLSG